MGLPDAPDLVGAIPVVYVPPASQTVSPAATLFQLELRLAIDQALFQFEPLAVPVDEGRTYQFAPCALIAKLRTPTPRTTLKSFLKASEANFRSWKRIRGRLFSINYVNRRVPIFKFF